MAHEHNEALALTILAGVARGVWHTLAACALTLAWALLTVWMWFQNPTPWNWIMSAGCVAIAIMSHWAFPAITPVVSDVRRIRARRGAKQQRRDGYRVARDLALVPEVHDEETALKRPRRLPDARFTKHETSCTLDAPQTLPSTIQQIAQRAIGYAPVLKMRDDQVEVTRPSPERVQITWRSTPPIDLLATPRAGSFEMIDGAPLLGRVDSGADFTLDLIGDAWHVGLQGTTRSGKSVGTYGLLAGYAAASRQGRVIIGGIDPTALLLSAWDDHPGREFRAVGLADLEAILAALDTAVVEMERRIAWLLEAGRDKTKPEDFAPLIFVLEEYPGLIAAVSTADAALSPKERRLPRVKNAVQRLVQEGAKAGMRVVLIAQRFDASIIGGSERSNLGTRISCRLDNRDAVTMLHPDADPETVERIRGFAPGYAYVECPGEFPRVIRFDAVDYQQYREHVMQAGNTDECD